MRAGNSYRGFVNDIFIEYSMIDLCWKIWIFERKNNERWIVHGDKRTIYKDGGKLPEPTIVLEDPTSLNDLGNCLNEMGFGKKPEDTTKEVKRLENHLEDMKTIAFKQLKIKEKK